MGRVGPRNSGQVGGEFSLTSWTCSCKPCFLDLSFGVAPVCCHSEKTKRVLGHLGSWDSIIRNTCTEPGKIWHLTNPNGGFVECCFLDRVGLGCQFPNIFGLSILLKLQSQNKPWKIHSSPHVDRTPTWFPQ